MSGPHVDFGAVIDFRSDNTHAVSPEILEALNRAASGTMTSYGSDAITGRVRERCRDLFETDVEVFPVITGTAGNAIAISSMTPPWGGVFCHAEAHIHLEELGASEFYSGGAKLFPIAGADGKLTGPDLGHAIRNMDATRTAVPSCVSVTQATEAGTLYRVDEVRAIRDAAPGLRMHMDGARFANAVASLGCLPAEATWKSGVDVLVFGGTKNGAMGAELLVVFRKELAREVELRWIRSGHRTSKSRFLSAQFEAYLENDLWLRNARRANASAARLAKGIAADVLRPVEANVVFARFDGQVTKALRDEGFLFHDWSVFGPGAIRLVCAFDTTDEDVDALVAAVERAKGNGRRA